MNAIFNFKLIQPSGLLSAAVQGIWSASTSNSNKEAITKPLYGDAGSGFLFNLGEPIELQGQTFNRGIFVLPNQKHACSIVMPPGSHIAGIRFHPAIGYSIWGKHHEQINEADVSIEFHAKLKTLGAILQTEYRHEKRIEYIQLWFEQQMNLNELMPDSLESALYQLNSNTKLSELEHKNPLSQRQIERLFRTRLDMTPKHFQRIIRVQRTLQYLRKNSPANLVDVALQFGFSDQAHMTREFRTIAHTTPAQFSAMR